MTEDSQKKIVKIILILMALGVFGWLIFINKSSDPTMNPTIKQPESPPAVTPQVVQSTEKESSSLQKLSQDIPHYEQSEKIESYTLQYPNSTRTQDVYRFYSLKNMDENLSFYTGWASSNGWKIENTVKEASVYSLYLTKEEETLVVKISSMEEKIKISLDLLKG